MTTTTRDADTVAINTIRALCMDAIQKVNSGHPGQVTADSPASFFIRPGGSRGGYRKWHANE